ncbi:MAG TPA: serine hydrolase [Acidimicrobiales bacterium]|nr:serine hydrolase [Acidimicrobiales bacterium]
MTPALPPHPDDVAWPTEGWPVADPPDGWGLPEVAGAVFSAPDAGATYAVAAAHRGRRVFERHAGALEHWDRPAEPVGPATRLLSWSVAKSVLHLAVGVLVGEGLLDLHAPAPVPGWASPGDPRRAITLEHLLTMRDGLDWVEAYDPAAGRSDVITMLFGGPGAKPQADVAAFAADRAAVAEPGARYLYSSGTTNIVSGIVARTVGPGPAYEAWLRRVLFDPLGADPRLTFDDAGTWIASSYLYATSDDWLRIGELVLRDGVWEGRRLLPAGWVDHGRRLRSPDDGLAPFGHGAHWWADGDRLGTFAGEGYEGQWLLVVPGLDLVVARFGKAPPGSGATLAWVLSLLDTVAGAAGLSR